MKQFTHGSLFSGIGGFDLAAEWMQWKNVFHCEINPFAQKVLKYHFPDSESLTNIITTDFKKYANKIDILTGGFPCQPFSVAGKRKGTQDERHLWPEMLRAIREIKPRWIVGENVSGIINWDGGMVFNQVQTDLENEGYEVQPFILPACAVNAPHRRDRVWFVAYSNLYVSDASHGQHENNTSQNGINAQCNISTGINNGYITNTTLFRCSSREKIDNKKRQSRKLIIHNGKKIWIDIGTSGKYKNVANTRNIRCNNGINNWKKRHIQTNKWIATENQSEWNRRERRFGEIGKIFRNTNGIRLERRIQTNCNDEQNRKSEQGNEISKYIHTNQSAIQFQNFPTKPPICGGNDGIPAALDGITFSKWRKETIKGYGNAIVPQVALQIFKAIEQYEKTQP